MEKKQKPKAKVKNKAKRQPKEDFNQAAFRAVQETIRHSEAVLRAVEETMRRGES